MHGGVRGQMCLLRQSSVLSLLPTFGLEMKNCMKVSVDLILRDSFVDNRFVNELSSYLRCGRSESIETDSPT